MSLLTNVLKLWRTGQYLLPADSGFMVKHLFANGEPGFAKLDFSGFAGMYQDRARTIPYTAVEQPLGSFTGLNGVTATAPADVNRGVVSARVNLLLATDDMTGSNWEVGGGYLSRVAGAGTSIVVSRSAGVSNSYADILQYNTVGAAGVNVGKTYVFSVELSSPTPINAGLIVSDANYNSYSVSVAIDSTPRRYSFTSAGGAGWNPSGTNIGAGLVFPVGASGVVVNEPQLTTIQNAHLPYQRVNTATDYDTAGFPHYLKFNGTNTTYTTPSIDFTGTDKMTVWAGITKLSDAALGVVVEFGSSTSVTGMFGVYAPSNSGATFGAISKGTILAFPAVSGHTSPKSTVLTEIGDISGAIATVRVNGVPTTITINQGTGNYGNYPMYIGARAGTSLFFNGRLYSLIVPGAQSSLSQIEAVENLIRKTMRLP